MSISAMKYALDVLDNYVEAPRCETHRATAVHFLEQAIAEAEKQEPVAWREVAGKTTKYYDYNEDGRGEPLYAAPPKREWVGLTDDEIWDCYTSQGKQFYLAIEAKLKEKNT
jgi:hypothetical protein